MTSVQKVIKYLAMAFAIFLVVSIIGGIVGAIGIFGGFFGSVTTEDLKGYAVTQDVSVLDIDVNAADLRIEVADTISVESNLKDLSVVVRNGTLYIKETRKIIANYNDPILTVFVPEGYVFDRIKIDTGAGRLTASCLSASSVQLDLGAGEVNINELNASTKAEINGGAGAVTISGGALRNLELDMGLGKLDLTSELIGDNELDMGIGEANITLIGTADDYRIELDKGIGNATIDGHSIRDGGIVGTGRNIVDIDGGIGAIKVKFN